MRPGRFALWAKARQQYRAIMAAFDAGQTVYVCTQTRATRYAAKHRDLFLVRRDGVYVRHGKQTLFLGFSAIVIEETT